MPIYSVLRTKMFWVGHVSYGSAYGIKRRKSPDGEDQFRTLEFDNS